MPPFNIKRGSIMARICPLFSSSSGNSIYIRDDDGKGVLIDAGVSYKRLSEALIRAGGDFENLSAIFITHEHSDHIAGVSTLLKKHNIPLYATAGTIEGMIKKGAVPKGTKVYEITNETAAGDIIVKRFATSHDANEPSGYSVTLKGGKKITVCTDLGVVTNEVRQNLLGSNLVFFESNHDVEMLKRGPYPPPLKIRILSDKGHLSNISSAAELPALIKGGTTRIILGHLSKENNLPTLARLTAVNQLKLIGAKEDEDYILTVAKPEGNGVTAI